MPSLRHRLFGFADRLLPVDLPAGVGPFPTLLGKKRFQLLQAFNLALACYILLHQVVTPLTIYWLQVEGQRKPLSLGWWHLYHFLLALLLMERFRTPLNAFRVVYLAWFAVGYIPFTFLPTLFEGGALKFQWKTLSALMCYGSSLVWTLSLLHRMRMPTTAWLFGLGNRIIPRWRYAVPFFALGFLCSGLMLLWLGVVQPPAGAAAPAAAQTPPATEASKRRYQYE
jgi:hypothetical protein